MNAFHLSSRATLLAALACIPLTWSAAHAQTAPADGPLPPPAVAPESRLTVTPAEFEQWLAGMAPADDTAIAREEEDAAPSLVTPPPPPPVLVTPPPPAPTLVTPPPPSPPPATVTPAPATAPAAAPPGTTPQPPPPSVTAPPAPVLEPPSEPRVATLPPDSPVTTPPRPAPESLARPDAVKILYPEGVMELPEAAKPDLERMAAWLRRNPDIRVLIVGYASESAAAGNQARRPRYTGLWRCANIW